MRASWNDREALRRLAREILRGEGSRVAAQTVPKHCLPASGEDREDAS
jgi:hypothetical protein